MEGCIGVVKNYETVEQSCTSLFMALAHDWIICYLVFHMKYQLELQVCIVFG